MKDRLGREIELGDQVVSLEDCPAGAGVLGTVTKVGIDSVWFEGGDDMCRCRGWFVVVVAPSGRKGEA